MKIYLKAPQIITGLAVAGFSTEAIAIFFPQLKFDFMLMFFYLFIFFVFIYKSKSATSTTKADNFIGFIKPKIFPVVGGLTALLYFFRLASAIINDDTADGGAVLAVIFTAAITALPHCLCIAGTIKDNRKLIQRSLIVLAFFRTISFAITLITATVTTETSPDLLVTLHSLISQIILIALYAVGYLFLKDDNYIKLVSQLYTLKIDHSKGKISNSEYDEAVKATLANL